jgi:hypothetical protein
MQPGAFLALVQGLPEMEFHVPRPYDRALWTGTADVVVAGMSRSFRELYAAAGSTARVTGYTTDGQALSIGLDEYFKPPLLLVRPAAVRFGSDPEAARQAAPKRSSKTISTRGEELLSVQSSDCGPEAVIECDTGGGGNTNYGGYFLTHSFSACTDAAGHPDADEDGLRDACEIEIAKAFAPALRFDRGEVHWGRHPYWSVARDPYVARALKIFYLIAYEKDGGDPGTRAYAHDGDSEFLIVYVQDITGGGRWALDRMTYSAHWHSTWDRTHENLPYDKVEYTDEYRGRPRSWVGESKHPNYPNQSSCNGNFDDCHNPQSADTQLGFYDERNVGNLWAGAGVPLYTSPNCAKSALAVPYTECFWTDDTFRGWQTEDGGGSGGYKRSLSWYYF